MIELICGNCLEEMKKIKDGSVDMVLADPPYGTTFCQWDIVIPFKPMWEQLNRIIKSNCAIVLFGSEPFSSHLRLSNLKKYKYDWVWHKNKKTNFLNAKKQPLRNIELISVFNTVGNNYNPQKTQGHKPVNNFTKNTSDGDTLGKTKLGFSGGGQTDRYPTQYLKFSVVNNDNSGEDKLHPTQKPVALMEYLIKTYTNKNDTVLDFTMGSGTTMIAVKKLKRNGIGIELDKKYFEIAKERIENFNLIEESFQ